MCFQKTVGIGSLVLNSLSRDCNLRLLLTIGSKTLLIYIGVRELFKALEHIYHTCPFFLFCLVLALAILLPISKITRANTNHLKTRYASIVIKTKRRNLQKSKDNGFEPNGAFLLFKR